MLLAARVLGLLLRNGHLGESGAQSCGAQVLAEFASVHFYTSL
jgi:hypothetical protein